MLGEFCLWRANVREECWVAGVGDTEWERTDWRFWIKMKERTIFAEAIEQSICAEEEIVEILDFHMVNLFQHRSRWS